MTSHNNNSSSTKSKPTTAVQIQRQPAIFVNHGAGPIPYLDHLSKKKRTSQGFIIASCVQLGHAIETYKPKALCVISAHWEEDQPSIIYQETPSLYYDYGGFPPASYELQYNARCDLDICNYAAQLLNGAGFKNVHLNKRRGWDHGVFIPLSIAYPKADIPIIQISLHKVIQGSNFRSIVAERNLRLGSILYPLRDAGVMIVGSGATYHAGRNPNATQNAHNFAQWLTDTLKNVHTKQSTLHHAILSMKEWARVSTNGSDCHRREEHLLPLHVCLGTCIPIAEYDELMLKTQSPELSKTTPKTQTKSDTNTNSTALNDESSEHAHANTNNSNSGCSGVEITSGTAMGTIMVGFTFN